MTARGYRLTGRLATAIFLAAGTLVVAIGEQSAVAAPPNYAPPTCPASGISIVAGQPTDSGVLQVARVAAPKAGGTEKWDLKYDPWLCNKTATSYNYASVTAEFLTGTTVTKTVTKRLVTYQDSDASIEYFTLPANSNAREGFFRPGEPAGSNAATLYSFPLPNSIKFTVTLKPTSSSTTGIITRTKTYPVAVQATPGPLGAQLFPLRQASLPSGAYYDFYYHDDYNLQNRYALDIGARRWDSATSKWTNYRKPNTSNPSDPINDHRNAQSWLIWGNTVRASADGEAVACVRGAPDNKPYFIDGVVDEAVKATQVDKFPGGNYLWVRTGNQTHIYTHLQQNSIPFDLCPHTDNEQHMLADPYSEGPDDYKYKITAGQMVGLVGNSGNTSNPHIHLESIMGTSDVYGGYDSEYGFGSDSRPMNFVNVKVQPLTGSNAVSGDWNELTSARVIPYYSIISPNDCGYLPSTYAGKKEVVQVATTSKCWAQMYNAMIQAGFRPIHYDSNPSGTSRTITTVWRPNDGTSWVLLHGLDAPGLQAAHNKYTAMSGWRYLNLESYTVNGAVRYAVIFVKQAGASQFAQGAMSLATFNSVFGTKSNAGYRMVDYSVAVVNNVRQYTGLWTYAPGVNSYVVKDVAVSGYQALFNSESTAGRMPVSLNGYSLNGTPYLATVWYGKNGAPYGGQHAMSSGAVQTAETTNLASNLYARAVTEYVSGSTHYFAAVWRGAPSTSLTAGPSGSTASTSASFSFNSPNDKLATFECKIDGGRYGACTSPKSYTGLTHASHTFYVRARDFQGVYDATPATRTWTIT